MWRSIVGARRGSLSRHRGAPKFHSPQNPTLLQPPQVPPHCQTLLSLQHGFHSHLCKLVSLKTPFHQNLRFFSHDSSDPTGNGDERSPLTESSTLESNENCGLSDSVRIFDFEKISSVSLDFDEQTVSNLLGSNEISDGYASGNDESVGVDDIKIEEIDLEKLESVLSLLQSSGTIDGSLEFNLENMGLTLNEEFVVRVLETPFVPGDNLIGFFKWVLKNLEFSVTTKAVDALVGAISAELKKKNAYALWDLVKEIGEKENGVLTTEILNELISLFSRLGKGKAGFEVFNKFGEFGCVMNADTYYFTIEALCRRSIYDWACSVCEKMINAEVLPDSEKIGKIISFLCKGSKAKDAHLVYLSAKEIERYPPRSSVNFLINSLCLDNETVHSAFEMLADFSGEERKYAIKPFSSVIRALCRIKDIGSAKILLLKMFDEGPPPGNAVFNSIINGLSKAGDMVEATKMVKMMENRGLKPDLYSYSVIMSGYVKGGEMEEACKVLADAKKKHSKLTPVTYHTLIRGYCKLEQFDKALNLLNEMKEYGVQPNADEYNKLIQSLCLKTLDWTTAEKLMKEMEENGLHLNGITKGLIRSVKELEEERVEIEEVNVEA